ncbi:Tma20p [Malassezia vespertilionis]|uniref:Translation machinery-associated protein 20 n=1 Tax=Malassezia vespertilionis TaxID=2020962 RepID=A0A2N1JFX1_9BASI|nr:Tma20p [Malassezia vespertilionis]
MSLFKKLDVKADLGTPSALKSSMQRGIRTKILEQYEDTFGADDGALLEKIWPKKEPIMVAKFKCCRPTPLTPDPMLLPSIQVDRGAIKFLLSGANVMSPGLTSAGGRLPDPSKGEKPLKKGDAVGIQCQGKDHQVAVGVMQLDSEEIRLQGKGIAVDNVHYIGGTYACKLTADDLWAICSSGGLQ